MFNYSIIKNRTTGEDAIRINDEPFEGIIFSFGQISFNENKETNWLNLNFEYQIIDKANKEFGNLEPFEEYLGELLQDIIHRQVEEINNIA